MQLELIAWAFQHDVIDLFEARQLLGGVSASAQQHDKLDLSDGELDHKLRAIGSRAPRDSEFETLFAAIFNLRIKNGDQDATGKLYEVMNLVSDLGVPPSLEWMVFLWPSNPYKDVEGGDQKLYEKIKKACE
jgi:hypothetical protein